MFPAEIIVQYLMMVKSKLFGQRILREYTNIGSVIMSFWFSPGPGYKYD
jgi:hypothetical protein